MQQYLAQIGLRSAPDAAGGVELLPIPSQRATMPEAAGFAFSDPFADAPTMPPEIARVFDAGEHQVVRRPPSPPEEVPQTAGYLFLHTERLAHFHAEKPAVLLDRPVSLGEKGGESAIEKPGGFWEVKTEPDFFENKEKNIPRPPGPIRAAARDFEAPPEPPVFSEKTKKNTSKKSGFFAETKEPKISQNSAEANPPALEPPPEKLTINPVAAAMRRLEPAPEPARPAYAPRKSAEAAPRLIIGRLTVEVLPPPPATKPAPSPPARAETPALAREGSTHKLSFGFGQL